MYRLYKCSVCKMLIIRDLKDKNLIKYFMNKMSAIIIIFELRTTRAHNVILSSSIIYYV